MADDTEPRIAAIVAKIQTFRKHMEGAQAMRGLTTNPEVQRGAEAQIRDIQRNISYLEDSLRVLQGRRSSTGPSGAGGGSAGAGAGPIGGRSDANTPSATSISSSGGPGSYRTTSTTSSGSGSTYPTTQGGAGSPYNGSGTLPGRDGGYPGDSSSSYLAGGAAGQGGQRRFDDKSLPTTPTGGSFGDPPPGAAYGGAGQGYGYGVGQGAAGGQGGYGPQGEWRPAGMGRMGTSARRNFTNLDLIKYDTPHTTAKISRMLHQLEFKLQIEKQYKQGIDKMAKLYQAEGDRKSKNDAESKRVESQSKIVLLQQSLKRYKQLHVMDESEDDSMPGSVEDRRQNLRKPLSGTLQVSVRSARDVDHAPQPRMGRSVRESIVVIKVEDTPRAKTHPSRNDRWQEDFEIAVDNANEIEVTVYDRIGTSHPVPVGMLWIRISDIVEELRKKKFGQVSTADGSPAAPGGWMPAEDLAQARPGGFTPGSTPSMMDAGFNAPAGQPVPLGPPSEGVEAWFAVEPVGAIFLRLNFIKQNVRKRPYDARLGRQGAFRKRKEDVAEINGHKFISRQFYQIIRCALCGELLLNAAGSQCEDCRYTCHKKCAMKVVTKCISKSNAEADRDEVKINHRIPHRFVNITNIGANWCCHCGYILPLGRKNAKKCSECDLTCHADCAHLVPDLCGMSMEMANQLLSDMDAINRLKSSAKAQAPGVAGAGPPNGGQLRPQPQGRLPSGPLNQGRPQTMLDNRMSGLEQQAGSLSLVGGRPQDGPYGGAAGQQPQQPIAQQPPQIQPLPSQQGLDMGRQGAGYGSGQPYGADPGKQPPRPLPQQPQPAMGPGGRMPAQGSPQQGPQHMMGLQGAPRPQQNTTPLHVAPQQQQHASPGVVPPQAQYGQPPAYGQAPPQQQASAPTQPLQQQTPAQQHQHQMALGQAAAQAQLVPSSSSAAPASSRRKIGLNDFNFLAVLGKGNFGKVMLAEEKKSGYLYAIKVLKKEFIIENDEVESTKSEKRVFLAAAKERHPFLLGLHSCFQTETRVYFVMEYVSGGDLMLHIQKEQFSPRRAKFYAAEVLLALEYFHKQGIIYRDLKLDNILLTLDGHVKVADYGLCKEDMWFGNTTSTFCGTPEFMAPEILLEQRYGRAVDWWAFGILIYEMLLGQAPFRGDDEDEIFDAILEDEPLYPIHMPPDSVSILHKLLTRDPARRLGSGPTDAEEIKAHPFFRDVNWDDMFHKRVPPPFCPTLKNPSDTSWFDTEFTSEKPTLTPVHSVLSAQDQREFASFSWTNPALA